MKAYNHDCSYCNLQEYYYASLGIIMAFILLFPLILLTVTIFRKKSKDLKRKKPLLALILAIVAMLYILLGEVILEAFDKNFRLSEYGVSFDVIFICSVALAAWFYNLNSETTKAS
ncbi:MAG: hypothetical protein JST32_14940 [Bacteroidetes bacterium]|nr:hypothetical protein [Bacteroidota bacterium]